jgi:hypothetical protein
MIHIRARHPECTILAALIAAESNPHGLFDSAADVLARYFADWSDDRKADLYARLAESLLPSDTMATMEVKCSAALWDNQNECLHV